MGGLIDGTDRIAESDPQLGRGPENHILTVAATLRVKSYR